MKARYRDWGSTCGKLAASAAALLCVCNTGMAASDGTIYFRGAIVESPFSVTGSNVDGEARAGDVAVVRSNASAATVVFAAQPNSSPRAEVTLVEVRAVDALAASEAPAAVPAVVPIETRFTDGARRSLRPGRHGEYRIGASGGVLSLTAKGNAGATQPRLVTVVTRYD